MLISLKRIPWVTLLLVSVLVVGAMIKEPAQEILSLNSRIGDEGCWWQALSCHAVHFGWGHFWRDVPALALLGGLIEARSRTTLLSVLGVAAGAVPAAVLLLEPALLPYRGSSGLVIAAFAWLGANAMLRGAGRQARWAGVAALAVLAAKIWMEMSAGRLMMVAPIEVRVSWSAHFGGAMAGLAVFFLREAPRLLPKKAALHPCKGSRY